VFEVLDRLQGAHVDFEGDWERSDPKRLPAILAAHRTLVEMTV
jgi:hypothetical protein